MKKQQKKDFKIRCIAILLCLIAISNTPPVQFFTLDNYHYQNADDSFTYTEYPEKGLDFEEGITRWERFKREQPDNPNRILYRTFRINPLKFWEWWQFISRSRRYSLPVKWYSSRPIKTSVLYPTFDINIDHKQE